MNTLPFPPNEHKTGIEYGKSYGYGCKTGNGSADVYGDGYGY